MGCNLDVYYFPVHPSDSAEMYHFKKSFNFSSGGLKQI